jgi:hypothetical protein
MVFISYNVGIWYHQQNVETDLKLILMEEELWSFVPLSTIFQLYRGGLILMDLIYLNFIKSDTYGFKGKTETLFQS